MGPLEAFKRNASFQIKSVRLPVPHKMIVFVVKMSGYDEHTKKPK